MNSLRASTPALKITFSTKHHDMQLETSKEPAAGAGRKVEQEGDGGVERALQPRPALQTVAALLAHNHLEGNSGHVNEYHVRGAWRISENPNKFEVNIILIFRHLLAAVADTLLSLHLLLGLGVTSDICFCSLVVVDRIVIGEVDHLGFRGEPSLESRCTHSCTC